MKPRLRELIKPKVTQSSLAREYGCSRAYVCNIASGKVRAPARFKLLCSQKLGLPVSVIFPEGEK